MKKYFLIILIFSFIIPIVQKPIEVEALSCLFVPDRIGVINTIPEDKIVGGNFQKYSLEEVFFPAREVNLDTLEQQQNALNRYLTNSLDELEDQFYPDLEEDEISEISEIFIPNIFENNLNIGDIIVSGGNQSVADCGGSSLTTLFDGKTKKPKFIVYSGVPIGEYNINGNIINLIGLDTPDDATESATFKINNQIINLNGEGLNILVNNNNKMFTINYRILNTLYLLYSTSQQSMWGGQPNATFVISLQQDSVINNNLCTINYSGLIRYGRIGEDVRQTQECLNNLGYNTGFADGIYGPKTYAGIREFQISQNIKVDGIVGPQTVSYLNNL